MFYKIDNTHIDDNLSLSSAVEGLDYHFKNAVRREFTKDREYGYSHLVDLSGGLDSRMVTYVAHEQGFTDQINVTYCRKDYLDFKIAQEIACDLKHMFLFMPLDYFSWYKDAEINTLLLNGSVAYAGSTGAHHMLELIKGTNCGIEHTGMVGDAIVGTFYKDKAYNYGKPDGKENAYSLALNYAIPSDVLNLYDNREQYSLCTRGLLGAQSSYMIRHNYFETASPFLDVDFLDFMMAVPLELRVGHRLYFEWLKRCYPKASEYGWEAWHGIQPKESNRKTRKRLYELRRRTTNIVNSSLGKKQYDNMNPIEHWLESNPDIVAYLDEYYRKSKDKLSDVISENYLIDMDNLYTKGTAGEREQVLTVFAAILMMLQ